MNLIKTSTLAFTVVAGLGLQACSSTEQASTPSATVNATANSLSLEQIYKEKDFKAERSTYFTWLDDGTGYTVLEERESDKNSQDDKAKDDEHGVKGNDIVFYNADGTGRKVLVSYEKLIPKGEKEPLTVESYQWSKDGKWLMVFTNGEQVWRSRSRGDFWLLNLETDSLYQLGGENIEAKKLMFAKFSPDSSKVAYVRDNNIYMEKVGSKAVTALTTDGNDTIVNGNFDWVYEEEFTIRDGFRWSPDNKSIAYWQLDTSGVKYFTMINNTDDLYPTLKEFPYPKAGEMNSAVKVGVVSLSDKKTRWAELGGDNRDRYIPRISWAGTGESLMIQDLNRPQSHNKVWLFDWQKQQLTKILEDKDDAFIEWFYKANWSKDGKFFIWHSERDGWRHLYRVSRDGKTVVDLTPGEYDIIDMLALNEDKNVMYFTASPDEPGQRYLFRTSLDGSSKPVRVTPASFDGSNSYYMSKDTSWAMHTFSKFGTPPMKEIIKVSDHSNVKTLVENKALKEKLATEQLPTHEFFTVNARDGVELDGYIMFPANMDKSKKYPIVFYVYGEPWGSTVQDRWEGNSYLYKSYLTQQGFIVASVDNRGTRAPKGRDWRKSIYKKIGSITVRDQVDALDAMAKRWDVIDTDRVGVWGHSGGGSSTLNLLFRHGDKYKVGIASAPVPDIRLYDTIYQERYAGNPNTDPESYDNTSPITFAKDLQGKLLLIHGTGDDNVHYQGSERLINELVKHNKQFEFFSYPNRSHSLREGEGTTLHYHTMMANFFEKHLLNK
ncbi:S9 family peptidase [Pseudoalteromonas shioyasakiensis]|uniref:S9 family peptidase n=1 Tax=Pseudoalteromonas shioyasakiensis TaxID=1190813 RepID=A0ABT6TX67_9GAMM|nr:MULTISPECIES: S9 family peptidase [Pseudoalteromonas]MDI4668508.1 S9 family peptidase [Pseudoalteromonas shioyasakiensis]MDI4673633.1 S9 family peptidase [Pseudoalteromonas shioyasakiensis]MDI4685818.1 S9 family peptidase [Pseudoalteromonas shioyasakiensis]MDI4703710.1 S9 family peptidase [Pseudoalteromonas shioyasakiensis]NUJ20754.1 S9 family peptidase [Pseudoalteromonas sp. 0802]